MKRNEIDRLKEVLAVQTTSYNNKQMQQYIKKAVAEIPTATWWEDKSGNIYVQKGEAELYQCFVAHTDTVHKIVPKHNFHIYESKNVLFSIDTRDYTRCGIGGDDKVGVYIALRVLRELEVVKCAFFVDEEVGCKGSAGHDTSFFRDVNVVMQSDRKGVREITSSIMGVEMYGEEFLDDIMDILVAHNYTEVDGGMTDVWQLATSHTKIPMFNVACGYYRPHTDDEFVNIVDIEDTYKFLMEVQKATHEKVYGGNWERDAYVSSYNQWGWDYYGFGKVKKVSKAGYKKQFPKMTDDTGDWKKELEKDGWYYDKKREMWKLDRSGKLTRTNIEDVERCPHCFSTDIIDGAFEEDKWCGECGAYLPMK